MKKVAGASRSRVNARGLKLECAILLHDPSCLFFCMEEGQIKDYDCAEEQT